MATKTITITEEAYDFLKKLKQKDESFTHLFTRLAKEKGVAEKYFGILQKDGLIDARRNLKEYRRKFSKDVGGRSRVLSRH